MTMQPKYKKGQLVSVIIGNQLYKGVKILEVHHNKGNFLVSDYYTYKLDLSKTDYSRKDKRSVFKEGKIRPFDPKTEKPGKENAFKKLDPDGSMYKTAYSAWNGVSFSPEDRAHRFMDDHNKALLEYDQEFLEIAKKHDTVHLFLDEMEPFIKKYRQFAHNYLHAQSRSISSMVTGPANFPTRRQEKVNNSIDNKLEEWNQWEDKAINRITAKLSGTPIRKKTNDTRSDLAVQKSKLEELKEYQSLMKEINKAYRNFVKNQDSINDSNLPKKYKELIRNWKPIYSYEKAPIQPYEMQNNLANIKRVEQRISELESKVNLEKAGFTKMKYENGVVFQNMEINRLQIIFDDKPDADIRTILKKNGFRWSPRYKAWQRQVTGNAMFTFDQIKGKIGLGKPVGWIDPDTGEILQGQKAQEIKDTTAEKINRLAIRKTENAIEVPIESLIIAPRTDEQIDKAYTKMRAASKSAIEPRAPIQVVKKGDKYAVLDGNRTALALKRNKAKTATVQVLETRTSKYPGIFGDYDGDGVLNVDDPNPLEAGDKQTVEEIKLSDEIAKLIDFRADADEKRKRFVQKVKSLAQNEKDVLSRTKTPFSIINKMRRKMFSGPNQGLTDLIGAMVIFDKHEDVENFAKQVNAGKLGQVLEFDDYYSKPKAGYMAYHWNILFEKTPVELQVKSTRLKKIAGYAHTLYKTGKHNANQQRKLSEFAVKADKGGFPTIEKNIDAMLADKEKTMKFLTGSAPASKGKPIDLAAEAKKIRAFVAEKWPKLHLKVHTKNGNYPSKAFISLDYGEANPAHAYKRVTEWFHNALGNPDIHNKTFGGYGGIIYPGQVNKVLAAIEKDKMTKPERDTTPDHAFQLIEHKESAKSQFSGTKEIPFSAIKTDAKRFQGRQGAYSSETVKAIVSKGFYDKSKEPIEVFKEGDKYIVISGHSRFEAIKQLRSKGAKNLDTIPVKVFNGDETEAIDYATLYSNRGSTAEGLKSDIAAYKRAIQQGYNRAKLSEIFKPESKIKKLRDLSNLNPKGRFLEVLDTEQEKSFPYLLRNAQWTGQIRGQYKGLTNDHEAEIFKYIYNTQKGLKLDKTKFFNLIEKKVGRIDFDSSKPLNLANIVSTNVLTSPIQAEINKAEKELDKLKDKIQAKNELIVRAKNEGAEKMVPKFKKDISDINKLMLRKTEEIAKLKQAAGKIERETVNDLFSMPAPATKKEAEKTFKKVEQKAARKSGKKFNAQERQKAQAKIRQIVEKEAGRKEELSPDQVLKIARRINSERSLYSILIDAGADHATRRAPTEQNLRVWAKNPGKSDLIGVDNFKKSDMTLTRDKRFFNETFGL
jgi:hypothetical protein